MGGFGNWLRGIGERLRGGMTRFMQGRYGTDKLNMTLLGVSCVLVLLSLLIPSPKVNLVLTLLAYGLMLWAIFRSLSRNTYQRYQENRKFRMLLDRFRDREHRYFTCPRCRQSVRVPKGKGKIAISCPKCKEKFVKKT